MWYRPYLCWFEHYEFLAWCHISAYVWDGKQEGRSQNLRPWRRWYRTNGGVARSYINSKPSTNGDSSTMPLGGRAPLGVLLTKEWGEDSGDTFGINYLNLKFLLILRWRATTFVRGALSVPPEQMASILGHRWLFTLNDICWSVFTQNW